MVCPIAKRYRPRTPALLGRNRLVFVVLDKGLAQVEHRRSPEANEDARLPPAAYKQVEREQDGEQGASQINSL